MSKTTSESATNNTISNVVGLQFLLDEIAAGTPPTDLRDHPLALLLKQEYDERERVPFQTARKHSLNFYDRL